MSEKGIWLTKTQLQIVGVLVIAIWIASFFLGMSVGRYSSVEEKGENPVVQQEHHQKKEPVSVEKEKPSQPSETVKEEKKYYTIVLGWESDEKRAQRIVENYEDKGLEGVRLLPTDNPRIPFRIVYGKFVDRADAVEVMNRLKKEKKIPQDSWPLFVK